MKLIGKGTSRDTYLLDNGLVMKKHLHDIGYRQSLVEQEIYNSVPSKFKPYFNPILEVTETHQICAYQPPYTSDSEEFYDISSVDNEKYLHFQTYLAPEGYVEYLPNQEELFGWLKERGVCTYELLATCNFGVKDNHIIFIDYGMTESLFTSFQEVLEKGEVRWYESLYCEHCKDDTRHEVKNNHPYCTRCNENKLQKESFKMSDNTTYGVFVNSAAGEIFINSIQDEPNGIIAAGGPHANLLDEFDTYEEAQAYMERYDGNRVHYLVYVNHVEGYAYHVKVVGEYFGSYQENAHSSYDNFYKDVDTLEEAEQLVAELDTAYDADEDEDEEDTPVNEW